MATVTTTVTLSPEPTPTAQDVLSTSLPDSSFPPQRIIHLIVLSHGIDGEPCDMHAIRASIERSAAPEVQVWETDVIQGVKTRAGIHDCADRVWSVLCPKIETLCDGLAGKAVLRVSFVGHSMGGLVLRSVATKLYTSTLRERTALDTLVCIASPHLGCRRLGCGGKGGVAPLMVTFGPSIMRAGLRLIKGQTGPDLLLDNETLEQLAKGDHHAALCAFRRRICYANGSGDWLVNFESASLLTAEEQAVVLPPSLAACRPPDGGVLWQPGRDEPTMNWPDTLSFRPNSDSRGDGKQNSNCNTSSLRLSPLPADWDLKATRCQHRTWDDLGGQRAKRACDILQGIRSCGEWELWLCHFFSRASFAGCVWAPHIDLIALPHQVSKSFGLEVTAHLATNLCSTYASTM